MLFQSAFAILFSRQLPGESWAERAPGFYRFDPMFSSKRKASVRVLGCCLVAIFIFIFVVLFRWGAREFRGDFAQVSMLALVGVIGVFGFLLFCSWLGISLRYDALERNNMAAHVAVCGAAVACGIIYAGANVGEGPSYTNNVFSFAAGIVALLLLWIFLESFGSVSKSVAEERDLASGIRLAGFLVVQGILLGRAVAGDWHSARETVADLLRDGWIAAPICVAAIVVEAFSRPSRYRPFPSRFTFGAVPALTYLCVAIAWVWHLGAWEGMSHE